MKTKVRYLKKIKCLKIFFCILSSFTNKYDFTNNLQALNNSLFLSGIEILFKCFTGAGDKPQLLNCSISYILSNRSTNDTRAEWKLFDKRTHRLLRERKLNPTFKKTRNGKHFVIDMNLFCEM